MMKIGVLFPFTSLFFISSIHTKNLVNGLKNEREAPQQSEEVPLYESPGYPMAYGPGSAYSQMMYGAPNYRSDIVKRAAAIDHSSRRRQTGIIYGDGKPIGILQPYRESFKFMPIKEERVYAVDNGRSSIAQQDPYVNLMYPLSRFTRSNDPVNLDEIEAAKAEFLDKHYPSMLVDFKIHNKLHPTGFESKPASGLSIKRSDTSSDATDDLSKKKRDNQRAPQSISTNQNEQKRESQPSQQQENHSPEKRSTQEAPQKRETNNPQKRDDSSAKIPEKRETVPQKRQSVPQNRQPAPQKRQTPSQKRQSTSQKRQATAQKHQMTPQKRQITTPQKHQTTQQKRQTASQVAPAPQKRQAENAKSNSNEQTNSKKKREGRLTDSEFDKLKNAVTKRHSSDNSQIIEEDLKGLLSDMGLIEDDLEDNSGETDQTRNAVVEDEDLEEGFDNPTLQKDKSETPLEQKRDSDSPDRKKRADVTVGIPVENPAPVEQANASPEAEQTSAVDASVKRSPSNTAEEKKRFIDVSFTTKELANKQPIVETTANADPKISVIPNKREAPEEKVSETLDDKKIKEEKFEAKRDASVSTTETYEQYEQRVAREIKNKIKQLKEEVKRELGALEEDKDEDDEDDTVGEPQRRKRYIVNTLMDEESHKIDPNENFDFELEPHVRRRRTLSTDLSSSFGDLKSSPDSFEESSLPDMNGLEFDTPGKEKYGFDSGGTPETLSKLDSESPTFIHSDNIFGDEGISKKDVLHGNSRTRKSNILNRFNLDSGNQKQSHWDDLTYLKSSMNSLPSEFQSKNSRKFAPSNVKRNSGSDVSSDASGDYDSDMANVSADEDTENMNAVADAPRKSEERKTIARQPAISREDHSPKKLQGYNQKYFYYYMGNKENADKRDSSASATGQRASNTPMYSYPQMTGMVGYPSQYYNTMNAYNRQYRKGANENGQNTMMYQQIYDKPYSRRRKRYAKNFLIPSKNTENAIVTNLRASNSSAVHFTNHALTTRSNPNTQSKTKKSVHPRSKIHLRQFSGQRQNFTNYKQMEYRDTKSQEVPMKEKGVVYEK